MQLTNKILDINELSKYLNCSVSMIRKLIYSNQIPFFKIGNKYEFEIDIIREWIINRHNNLEKGACEYESTRNRK